MIFEKELPSIGIKKAGSSLLSVKNLSIEFEDGSMPVRDLSFNLYPKETVALVGESGSGKSVTAHTILRLIHPFKTRGEILFENTNLLTLSEKQMRSIRGKKIAMIFQDPISSLNPSLTIGVQLTEMLTATKEEKEARALAMLQQVGISEGKKRLHQYPHELSGGMRQRIMIAMAMISSPNLLIADEPTTALDVTIQAQILELMRELKGKSDMTILLITHDLRVVASLADRVMVMYAGKIVESGTVDEVYENPSHPYTQGLFRSLPHLGLEKEKKLVSIPGMPPSAKMRIQGCAFAPRCGKAQTCCRESTPKERMLTNTHSLSCLCPN